MNEQDKKDIRQIFNEGLEQLVLPHFENIDKKFESIGRKFEKVNKDLEGIKKDVSDIKDDISVLQVDVTNIDKKLDAEIAWRDDASKRLKKVEVKLGFAK